jgi:hypothetical protein
MRAVKSWVEPKALIHDVTIRHGATILFIDLSGVKQLCDEVWKSFVKD